MRWVLNLSPPPLSANLCQLSYPYSLAVLSRQRLRYTSDDRHEVTYYQRLHHMLTRHLTMVKVYVLAISGVKSTKIHFVIDVGKIEQ
jgi:hypothetical protein